MMVMLLLFVFNFLNAGNGPFVPARREDDRRMERSINDQVHLVRAFRSASPNDPLLNGNNEIIQFLDVYQELSWAEANQARRRLRRGYNRWAPELRRRGYQISSIFQVLENPFGDATLLNVAQYNTTEPSDGEVGREVDSYLNHLFLDSRARGLIQPPRDDSDNEEIDLEFDVAREPQALPGRQVEGWTSLQLAEYARRNILQLIRNALSSPYSRFNHSTVVQHNDSSYNDSPLSADENWVIEGLPQQPQGDTTPPVAVRVVRHLFPGSPLRQEVNQNEGEDRRRTAEEAGLPDQGPERQRMRLAPRGLFGDNHQQNLPFHRDPDDQNGPNGGGVPVN